MRSVLDRVSYHAVYDDSVLDALEFARANGFAGVQVAVEAPHLSVEMLTGRECEAIAAFCAVHGLRVSLHGPDLTASLFETSRHLRKGIFEHLAGLFHAAARMDAKLITLHLGQMPSFGTAPRPGRSIPEADVAPLRRALDANLEHVIDLAAGRFILCIENFGLNALAMDVLEAHLDAGRVFLCWDLAKGRGDQAVQRFFWDHLSQVRQVHLHDVADGCSHQVIGAGELDFVHYLSRLAEVDVIDYCIEVRPRDRALESLGNLIRLIHMHVPCRWGAPQC
jgi:sugar phosphate isomerase/epimerase